MQETTDEVTAGQAETLTLRDQLRHRIVVGELPPGTLIPETALAEEFDVSRTPVREALKELQMEGLVHIRPRVGTFVHEPTRREIVEMFQIKESLEGLAASLMARRGDIPELDELQRNIDESDAAAAAGDSARYAELVGEFHWTLVRGADNHKLSETYNWLMNQLSYQRLIQATVSDPKRLSESDREHHTVLEAIRGKDPYGAEMAMRDHVYSSSRAALYRTFGHTGSTDSGDSADSADSTGSTDTEEQR